jgi:hypothetical protein
MKLSKRGMGEERWTLYDEATDKAVFDIACTETSCRFYVVSQNQIRHCAGFKVKEVKNNVNK